MYIEYVCMCKTSRDLYRIIYSILCDIDIAVTVICTLLYRSFISTECEEKVCEPACSILMESCAEVKGLKEV